MIRIIIVGITCLLVFCDLDGQIALNRYTCEDCSSYLVTEYNLSQPFSLSGDSPDRHVDVSANIGLMFKLSDKVGLGGHLFYGGYLNGGWHTQYGFRPRMSYYLNKQYHLDISPGVILNNSQFSNGIPGYSIGTALVWKDHIGIITRFDFLNSNEFQQDQTIVNIGLRTDGKKGILLTIASAVVAGVSYVISRN